MIVPCDARVSFPAVGFKCQTSTGHRRIFLSKFQVPSRPSKMVFPVMPKLGYCPIGWSAYSQLPRRPRNLSQEPVVLRWYSWVMGQVSKLHYVCVPRWLFQVFLNANAHGKFQIESIVRIVQVGFNKASILTFTSQVACHRRPSQGGMQAKGCCAYVDCDWMKPVFQGFHPISFPSFFLITPPPAQQPIPRIGPKLSPSGWGRRTALNSLRLGSSHLGSSRPTRLWDGCPTQVCWLPWRTSCISPTTAAHIAIDASRDFQVEFQRARGGKVPWASFTLAEDGDNQGGNLAVQSVGCSSFLGGGSDLRMRHRSVVLLDFCKSWCNNATMMQ